MKKTLTNDGVAHFTNAQTVVLSEALQDELDIKYSEFPYLLKIGAIYVNNERQTKDRWVPQDSVFRVHTKPRRYDCDYDWPALVVFENESFLVLNKPAGVPSHATVDNGIENSLDQTSIIKQIPLYVTHRLDAMTAGLIVYAKKRSFVKDFNILMMNRKISKTYVAQIETTSELPKKLVHYMEPSKGTPKNISADANEGWDICQLEILEQEIVYSPPESPPLSRVRINLLTGRTHQIRSQLSFMGAPIQGDKLYGARQTFRQNAIALMAVEIAFVHNAKPFKFSLEPNFDLEPPRGRF